MQKVIDDTRRLGDRSPIHCDYAGVLREARAKLAEGA
jgi:hypothetical protein